MKPFTLRSTLIALTVAAVPAIALPILGTQTFAAGRTSSARSGSTPTAAQKAVKAKDAPAVKRAKATQRVKAAQSREAAIPAGIDGTWAADPLHSRIGFAVRHLMINDVHGSFNDFSGTVVVNEKDFTKSSVDFTAKVASIDTNVPQRDAHLKSPDFFDAEKYPEITFKSTRVERAGDRFRATGTFTMHGVSKQISFPFEAHGPVVDGFGYTRASVKANLELNRQDYGVKWNQVLDKGGLAVSNIVRVNLDLEAVKAGTGPKKEEAPAPKAE
jgi:polyisoprenoid-binding protein YceI